MASNVYSQTNTPYGNGYFLPQTDMRQFCHRPGFVLKIKNFSISAFRPLSSIRFEVSEIVLYAF